MNAICLLQLTAVFLIAAIMVSTMYVRYIKYEPVKELLESTGVYSHYLGRGGAVIPGGNEMDIVDSYFWTEDIREYMEAKSIVAIQYGWFTNEELHEILLNFIETDEELPHSSASGMFYDDFLIECYTPQLKSGRWIDPESDELEIVIVEGALGLNVGDTLKLYLDEVLKTELVTVRVVGILENGADILGRHSSRVTSGDTYRYLYQPYYVDVESGDLFLASAGALHRLYPAAEVITTSAFILYDSPDIDMDEVLRHAAQINSGVTIKLDDMNSNSRAYLREQLLRLLPIVIVLMILVVVSSVSVSAIAARRRLRDYAKYYVLGLRWGQCAMVNLFQSLTVAAAALIISVAAMSVISVTALSEAITVIWNGWTILALLGILILYLIFSMIMPLIMLSSTTPKSLLQSE